MRKWLGRRAEIRVGSPLGTRLIHQAGCGATLAGPLPVSLPHQSSTTKKGDPRAALFGVAADSEMRLDDGAEGVLVGSER
ncbi:hypothetical protein, partial [Stutzerimonas balearica]|uniref:hypothetical protein n=1 Tax=Stutzerimonas balearica TaxID=74829 RepID=UPI00289D5198